MFNITSNTTLITDEVLKFLYDNEFSLTVSLDGDRQAHDKNRVFAANGAGTFSVVMQILEKIQTQYPDYMERVHINAVIDPTTDFDCTSNFFSDYKTVKDFIYRQILFLNIIVRMKWQQMKSIGKNLVMKYLKCIFKN